MNWNDGLLSNSLEASKLSAGLVINKVTGSELLRRRRQSLQ
jgi:hypothetical protein